MKYYNIGEDIQLGFWEGYIIISKVMGERSFYGCGFELFFSLLEKYEDQTLLDSEEIELHEPLMLLGYRSNEVVISLKTSKETVSIKILEKHQIIRICKGHKPSFEVTFGQVLECIKPEIGTPKLRVLGRQLTRRWDD